MESEICKMTLEEAKQFLRDNWEKGTNCPCCKQSVKLYKRKLNSGMAYALMIMYRIDRSLPPDGDRFFEAGKEIAKTVDVAIALEYNKLAYWGLIETRTKDSGEGNSRSGLWRITQKGKDFVEDRISVPRWVYVYDAAPRKVSEEKTTIKEALGDKFNYAELMGNE